MEHETSFRILSCLSRTYHAYAKRDHIASRFLALPPNLFCPSIQACRALSPSLNSIVFYHIFPQPCKRLHQKGQNLLAPYNYRPYLQLLNLHSSGLTQTTTRSRSIPALAITSNLLYSILFPRCIAIVVAKHPSQDGNRRLTGIRITPALIMVQR